MGGTRRFVSAKSMIARTRRLPQVIDEKYLQVAEFTPDLLPIIVKGSPYGESDLLLPFI
jgi:hypothetical protein